VSITKAGFVPAVVTIPNGDSVTWKNNDTASHQIVSNNGTFTTTCTLAPGESPRGSSHRRGRSPTTTRPARASRGP
jgi:plastocyanin